jgi:hypothetical protein
VKSAIPGPGAAVKAEPARLPGPAVLAALIAQQPGDYPSRRIKRFGELIACCHLRLGDRDRAVDALSRALALGFRDLDQPR